jgi:type I restriction enzyme S subunit
MKLLKDKEHVRLGSICTKIGSGATPRGGDGVYVDAGTSFIRSQNVYNGVFETAGLTYLTDQHSEQLKGVAVESRDVLLNITGDSVARCCQVPDSVLPARVNQHVSIIRPDEKELLPEFLCYYLISPLMQKYLLSRAGSGGTRKALTKGMIEDFEIPKPAVFVQRRIVEILSAYDDLIENNRRRIQLLEQAAQLLYKEWFVYLRFPGHEHTQIIDGLPEGWENKVLGDLCFEVRETISPSSLEANTPYIGLEHMPRRSITLCEWGQAEQVTSSKHRFREREILFGKIRPYFHKVGVALTDGVASSDAIIIRPVNPHLLTLVLMTTSSDAFVAVTAQQMKEGSKMPRADWKQMQKYPVPLPPDGLLRAFNDFIDPILNQLKMLAFANKQLCAARDLLLPKLMNGEVAA